MKKTTNIFPAMVLLSVLSISVSSCSPTPGPEVTAEPFTNSSTPTWRWKLPEDAERVRYRLKDETKTWTEGDSEMKEFTPSVPLSDGDHTLLIQFYSKESGWSESGEGRVIVDTTPPEPPEVTADTPTTSTRPVWNWTVPDGTTGFRYRFDSDGCRWASAGKSTTSFSPMESLADGEHTLLVQASDRAGNWSESASSPVQIGIYEKQEPLDFTEGSWTLAVIPDTQCYVMDKNNTSVFTEMTEWLRENSCKRNIGFVLHEGDITNNNDPEQWERAKASMSILDNHIPYAMTTGNHDLGSDGSTDSRDSLFSEYFNPGNSAEGLLENDNIENAYYLFSKGKHDYLILSLEWGPRDPVLDWAGKIIEDHPNHRVILLTHAYLYSDNTRYDWDKKTNGQKWNPLQYRTAYDSAGSNDGEDIWNKILRMYPNIVMVFSGHVLNDGTGYLSSTGDNGNKVHQMLFNTQQDDHGGNGWLRLIEFLPDEKTVQVKTYSPYLNRWKTGPENVFTFILE